MRLFRREWIVPALALAFVSASAQASRDEISAQAAGEMHCNSVAVIQSGPNEYLASGCGRDWQYTCDDEGECSSADATHASVATNSSEADDEAAEAIGSALTDLACACASAGLSSHGSHHGRASSEHHHHKQR